ncbi:MAG: DnaJ C-terminal domain-containing protein, partial [Candidatus Methylomirabilales bacterium]
ESGFWGGASGDLYVEVNIKEHPLFERRGDDLFCEVPISFVQAALGAEIRVPTLEGMTKLKIPPGTQSGSEFRISGKGFPNLRGHGRGDLVVRVFVEVPTSLTLKQRELLQEFARLQDGEGTPLTKSFLEKVKKLFG